MVLGAYRIGTGHRFGQVVLVSLMRTLLPEVDDAVFGGRQIGFPFPDQSDSFDTTERACLKVNTGITGIKMCNLFCPMF